MKYKNFKVLTFLSILVWNSSVQASNLDKIHEEALKVFDKTSDRQQNKQNQKYLKTLANSFRFQNNFSINSTYSQSQRNESSSDSLNNKVIDQNALSFGVSYTDWNGLDLEVSATNTVNTYQADLTLVENPNQYLANTAQLSYELIQEGQNGVTRSRNYANYQGQMSQYYGIKNEEIEITKRYQNHLFEYAGILCKLNALQEMKNVISRSLRQARASQRAKTIAYRDFLNYEVLNNNIDTQIITNQNQKNILLAQAKFWGESYTEYLAKMNITNCYSNTQKQNINPDSLAKVTPQLKQVGALKNQARYEKSSIDSSYLPSVKPFVQHQTGVRDLLNDIGTETSVGIEFSWIIPNTKSRLDTKSIYYKNKYTRTLEKQRLFNQTQNIFSLQTQINNGLDSLNIIQTSLRTFEKLIKTLKAGQAVGNTDPLSYSNNYLQYINTRIAEINTHLQITKAAKELELIKKVANSK